VPVPVWETRLPIDREKGPVGGGCAPRISTRPSPTAPPEHWLLHSRPLPWFATRGTFHGVRCDSLDMQADAARADPELLAAVAGADLGAMRLLYDRHAPWLSARLTRRCNSPEAVADVLQDTFMALWKGADRWRGDGEVAAWLWGIAARRLVSRLLGFDFGTADQPAQELVTL